MKQYLDLLQEILATENWQENRTGIRTKMLPGAMMKFDMEEGFPLGTYRKLPIKSTIAELVGFLRGVQSSNEFEELGCKFWKQNADENEAWLKNPYRKGQGDLGRIYGAQWRTWATSDGQTLDQIKALLNDLSNNPSSRRIIVNAWRPDEFNQMALPPCHVLHQVLVEQATGKLHMTMYQRSCDMFLGVPANIASYSALLHLYARISGYKPGTFTWFGADVHIYENHVEQVKEILGRDSLPLPQLQISERIIKNFPIDEVEPSDFILLNYESHSPITAPMAV